MTVRTPQVCGATNGRGRQGVVTPLALPGGVPFEVLDDGLMLRQVPGVFCAGEMLDWEAPTGGYLLTACFASGRAAAVGILRWLGIASPPNA